MVRPGVAAKPSNSSTAGSELDGERPLALVVAIILIVAIVIAVV